MTSITTSFDNAFTPADVEFILAATFVDRVEHLAEVASTNTHALELAARSPTSTCTLVLTDRQTAGRGRGDNRWWSSDGALTFSVLLKPTVPALPTSRWPQLSLAAGLAVCDAVEQLVPTAALNLKWPNDVYLGGRKLAGILIEAIDGHDRTVIVGIGINVSNSFALAPADVRDRAVALSDATASPPRRIDILVATLQRLAARLQGLVNSTESLRRDWRRRCLLTGRKVHLKLPASAVVGVCRGIDDDGALLLETDTSLERCTSGVIVRFD